MFRPDYNRERSSRIYQRPWSKRKLTLVLSSYSIIILFFLKGLYSMAPGQYFTLGILPEILDAIGITLIFGVFFFVGRSLYEGSRKED